MSLSYDGKKIIPAPLVTIDKVYNKTGAGKNIGVIYNITLTGTLLPFRGSPSGTYTDIDDAFHTLSGDPPDEAFVGGNEDFNRLLRKQEAIRRLFSVEGRSLEWQPSQGQPVVKSNVRVISIAFAEGTWADRSDYTITLQADKMFLPTGPLDDEDEFDPNLIQTATQNWSFAEVEGSEAKTYNIIHTVTAQGITGYDELGGLQDDKEAWEHAADWVRQRTLGVLSASFINDVLPPSTWCGGNAFANIEVGEEDGTYSVVENFYLIENATTFTVKDFSFADSVDSEIFEVTYNGLITAIEKDGKLGSNEAILNAKAAVPTNEQAAIDASDALEEFLDSTNLGEPITKSIGVSQSNGSVSFVFIWAAGENITFVQQIEASIDFDATTGEFSLNLNITIFGKGETKEIRLDNARAEIPTDTEARSLMLNLLDTQVPTSIDVQSEPSSKGTSINETQGSIALNWSFRSTDSEFGDVKLEVLESLPADIFVEIPIPGRELGPIQQKMNTISSKVITVTLTQENNIVRPDDGDIKILMDDAGGILPDDFLQRDDISFDLITKNYRRTRTHTVNIIA